MDIKDFLSKEEQTQALAFIKNRVQLEAVRKVVLSSIYSEGTLVEGESAEPARNSVLLAAIAANNNPELKITDEQIGQYVRGQEQGIRLLQNGFNKLHELLEKPKKISKKGNPAI